MFYPEEVREVPEFRRDENISVKPQEVALAEKLVEGLAADFDPSKYHDEYQIKMQQMIEAKKEGLAAATSEAPKKRAPVIDLMQALQKSLGELPRKPATSEPKTGSSRKKHRSNVTPIKKTGNRRWQTRSPHGPRLKREHCGSASRRIVSPQTRSLRRHHDRHGRHHRLRHFHQPLRSG